MSRLEEALKRREQLAKILKAAGAQDAFSLHALHDLIRIVVHEARASKEYSEKLFSSLEIILQTIESRKDIIEHAKRIIELRDTNKIEVSNLSEIPREITVQNLDEIKFPKSLIIDNLKDIIFPESISISDRKPSWYSEFDFTRLSKELLHLAANIINGFKKLSSDVVIKNKKPAEAIPVRLVDKTGKDFYNVESGKGGGTFISDNKLSYGKGMTKIDPISVGSAEQEYALPSGKKYLAIQNKGPALVAFGPTGLNYSDYPTLTPRQFYEFIDCKDGFKVYFICDSGKTSTIVGFTR